MFYYINCVHVHMCICMYKYTYVYMHICTYIHTYIYAYTHVHVQYMYVCVYLYLYLYLYLSIYLSIYLYIYIYIYEFMKTIQRKVITVSSHYVLNKRMTSYVEKKLILSAYKTQNSKLSSWISVLRGSFYKTLKKLVVCALSDLKHSAKASYFKPQ